MRAVIDLRAVGPADRAGVKATTLADLARDGFPVPPGFVITTGAFETNGELATDARAAVRDAARHLGDVPLAVRSSALAEDRPDASYAGQYLTLLNVRGDEALFDAIRRVRASGGDARVAAYGMPSDVAILVQPIVDADAAGVAFTADPVTGERDVVVVQAVRGLADRLVSGLSNAEEWRVRKGTVESRGSKTVLDAGTAREIAELARRIERRQGRSQDIEWALANKTLQLLQARPMTALPDAVRWEAPPGAFARNFRLGEWIGEPVTPLFESWLLTTMEETMHGQYARMIGQPAPRPLHILVNGWYYYSLGFLPASFKAIARTLPGLLVRLARDPRRVAPAIPPLARFGIDLYVREWRDELLPAYVAATERATGEVERRPPEDLPGLVDELAILAGRYFTSITMVAGYGWKTEIPLAQFYRRHLRDAIGGHHQLLLRGLSVPLTSDHAVQSLDWAFPTHGELAPVADESDPVERHGRLARERDELERRARHALPPKLRARFDHLLAEAQRAARLREEQVPQLTLPWPALRRAIGRLGETLVARGVLGDPHDAFFLTRDEILAALRGQDHDSGIARERRARWERQRRLVAPLVLGRLPKLLQSLLGAAERALRDPSEASPDAIRGVPASPGRATGRARVIRSVSDFDRLAPGEVLICPVTTPAWTPLFARAAAVVADVGSPSAHASIIAREYGIPAVVGTGDATSRIADGALVTVDGGAGLVIPADQFG